MKGDPKVLELLNKLLTGELSAADQYFVHSRMQRDWGFEKLYEHVSHEMQEELEHAEKLIERILFLEGIPNVASRDPINVGKSVPEMLQNDLDVELQVVLNLKDAMATCEQLKDYQTREILQSLLQDTEEDHTYWLEQQLGLIDKIGLQNYLQSQI